MNIQPNPIRVALVQMSLVDNAPRENMQSIALELEKLSGQADLAVLPEVFTTACSRAAIGFADDWQEGRIREELAQLSLRFGIGIAGSYFALEGGEVYNRFVLIDGDSIQYQDKRHLFALGGESEGVRSARERKILTFRGWRILPLVCYDLRFPVWARCVDKEYDILITVASWPRGRRLVWQSLLVARAMENLAYSIGVNRVGEDASGLSYAGDSLVADPRGREMIRCAEDASETVITTLDYVPLTDLRRKFPVWQDADRFTLEL